MRYNFESVLNRARLSKFSEDYFRSRLKEALHETAEENPAFREKINRWLAKFSTRAEVVFGFILETARQRVESVKTGLSVLASADAPSFVPQPSAARVLGTRPSPSVLSVEARGPLQPRITIDPLAKKVFVQIRKTEKPWPLVFLFPVRDGKGMIAEFRHVEGTDYLLAEFENVADGHHIVIFEPGISNEKRGNRG